MDELSDFLGGEELRDLDEKLNANEKPQVVLHGGSTTITATAQAIAEAIVSSDRVFSRGGGIWHVREDEDGVRRLHPVSAAKARSLFEDYCRFVTTKKDKAGNISYHPDVMSEATAKAILESEAFINGIFEIAVMSKVPFPLVSDGGDCRLVGKGYDAETKTLVTGKSDSIGNDLSIDDAVSLIKTLYVEFDFMTESDLARCIACLLTPAFRRAGVVGNRVPMEVSEADRSQSGKTLLQQVKAAVYGDTPELVLDRKRGVGSTDENFSAALLSGCPFVLFDNFRGKLNLTSLESFLTADGKFDCRAMRKVGAVKPENYFLGLTSNGAEMTTDLANRSCIVRIRKRPDGYEFRDYGDVEFVDYVKTNHGIFLSAVYSILKHWIEEGRPKTDESRHSFRPWARSMDWVVRNFFGLPPLLDGHENALERTANPHLTFLRQLVIKVAEREGFETRRYRASDLAEVCAEKELSIPGLARNQETDQDARNMAVGRIMKTVLKGQDEIALDEVVIRKETEAVLRGGSHGHQPCTLYVFSRA
jgi:hypothetical protein